MKEAIILPSYARIGDRVEMKMDLEARAWGRKGVPDGTMGTVVGFIRFPRWVGRFYEYGRKPGRYSTNGNPIVHWDSGEHGQSVSCHDLLIDAELDKKRRHDKAYKAAFDQATFEADLPAEIKLWEMDVVKVINADYSVEHPQRLMQIYRVNWYYYGDKRSDGRSWMPMYTLTPLDGGYTTAAGTDDVVLVSRGNLWNWFNSTEPVVWKDLKEELGFHHSMGWVEQRECPDTKNYSWPQESVLKGVEDGLIDYVSVGGMFGSRMAAGYYVKDRSLGERVRAECIKGFTPPTV